MVVFSFSDKIFLQLIIHQVNLYKILLNQLIMILFQKHRYKNKKVGELLILKILILQMIKK